MFRRDFSKKVVSNIRVIEETKPELSSQFKLTQDVLEAMNVRQFMLEYEADDIIGTIAKQFEKRFSIYLTRDQDALAVSEYTRLWLVTNKADAMTKEAFRPRQKIINKFNFPDNVFEFTPLWVEEFYGLTPLQ